MQYTMLYTVPKGFMHSSAQLSFNSFQRTTKEMENGPQESKSFSYAPMNNKEKAVQKLNKINLFK